MLVIAGAVAAAIAAYGAGAGGTYAYLANRRKWKDNDVAHSFLCACTKCNSPGSGMAAGLACIWPLFWAFWILAVGPAVKAHALVSGVGKERPALPPAKVHKR